jgi:hypothetical protein
MFTRDECKSIIDLSLHLPIKSTDGEYKNDPSINFTNWDIREDENTRWIYNRMLDFFSEKTGIQIETRPVGIGMLRYSVGDGFRRHSDTNFQGRAWNVGVNLNSEYEGGDFILYNPEIILPKIPGEIYCFESSREHEIKKITKGTRWSLILFIWGSHLSKKKFL